MSKLTNRQSEALIKLRDHGLRIPWASAGYPQHTSLPRSGFVARRVGLHVHAAHGDRMGDHPSRSRRSISGRRGMKLTKRHLRAMGYLSSQLSWVSQMWIPDGNGHTSSGGASNATMRDLKDVGYVEYGKDPQQSHYGYRRPPAGRAALGASHDE